MGTLSGGSSSALFIFSTQLNGVQLLLICKLFSLTLLHLGRPKLNAILAFLSAIGWLSIYPALKWCSHLGVQIKGPQELSLFAKMEETVQMYQYTMK